MPMNAATLSTAIFDALTGDSRAGFSSPMSATQQDMIRAIADAVAESVVAHIVANAAVTVTVASVSGVTVGGGVSGPGSGTGTIA